MAGFTNYLEDKIINHLFGDATGASGADHYTAPTTWYIGLHAGIYDAATSGNLVAYETLTKADFSTANPKTVNTGDIMKLDSANIKLTLD